MIIGDWRPQKAIDAQFGLSSPDPCRALTDCIKKGNRMFLPLPTNNQQQSTEHIISLAI